MMTRLARLFSLLALTVVLVACGGAATSITPPSGETGGKDQGLIAPDGTGVPNGGDGSALIVTSSLVVTVDDVDAAIRAAKARVSTAGGVLVGVSRGSDGYPFYGPDGMPVAAGDGPATLSFRIPADALETVAADLTALGTLVSERTDATDVSASLRDLGARLKNLRAAEANYTRLLEAATTVTDLLAVTAQLDAVRGQIEQLAAEEAALTDQVDRSLLALTLYPPATPIADAADGFDPGRVATEAIALLVGIGRGAVSLLIYALVLGLPLGLAATAVLLVARRLLRGRRR
jgi:hypothetical protein